jgi:hypothetical protein
MSRVGWLIRLAFGLDDWIYCALYIHTVRDYRQHSAIVILRTFQFTVPHALRFSVLTSRILATDVSQSHWHFKSKVKSSCHSLIPFFPFLKLLIPKTRLDYSRLLFYIQSTLLLLLMACRTFLITTLHGPHGRHRLLLSRMCVGMFSPPRCLAMDIHITVRYPNKRQWPLRYIYLFDVWECQ